MCSVKNINAKKDAFLIGSFLNSQDSVSETTHSHNHQNSSSELPLNTIEADLQSVLTQPLSERTTNFYDSFKTAQTSSSLEATKPWTKDANYFQNAHVSSLALLKMTIHARSGGSIEVMGMLTGKIVKNGIVVMDVYPLPVEGTETRVNAQSEGYEFMVQYLDSLKKTGRYENIVGWYHSHPGYGCWLSGIDVSTQSLNQTFQDPYLAIVIDPERTINQGKVEIGAFRTYPDEYVKNNISLTNNNVLGGTSLGLSPIVKGKSNTKQNEKKLNAIPQEKVKDFGLHSSKYYSLSIEIFRSNMDHQILQNLWNKYWINNLLINKRRGQTGQNEEEGQTGQNEQQNEQEVKILNKINQLSSRINLLKKTEIKQDLIQRPRRPKFTTLSSQSSISQLSPFTKASILNKVQKYQTTESDESDSEINDPDSDTDSRQDEEEDERKQVSPFNSNDTSHGSNFDLKRKEQFNLMDQLRDILPSRYESNRGLENTTNETKSLNDNNSKNESVLNQSDSAEAGRDLMSLKIQQILFLNE